jgi:sugar-specific transcriptional regulator TrmB
MIVKEEFLSKLRRYFSLNLYEVKIWTALLSRGVSTAGELSDIANVPRSRSYDVLESLEKKGFVIMKHGKPIKYIAVPPKEVLERVKKTVEEKTRELLKTIDSQKTKNHVRELTLLHERGVSLQTPLEISGSLSGRRNLYNHLETMLKKAKTSVEIVTSGNRFDEKVKNLKGIFDNLAKKRIRTRVALNSDKGLKNSPDLNKGIEIRKSDTNIRFCLVDGKEVLFMLFDGDEIHPDYDVGIWVVNPNLAKNMEVLFDNMWEGNTSFR